MKINLETLNLDTYGMDELEEIAKELNFNVEKYAEEFNCAVTDIYHLSDYALTLSSAMFHRLHGRVHVALRLEDSCNDIYKKLPINLQW